MDKMTCWNKILVVFAALLVVFLCKNLLAGQEVTDKLAKAEAIQKSVIGAGEQGQIQDKSEIIQKIQKLQMPFIANNGQTDERVKFYANTFGGTVFVTRDGEIVYSLPAGRGEEAGGRRREAEVQRGKG